MSDAEHPVVADPEGLVSYWIDFRLPPSPSYQGVVIDGEPPLRRALGRGVGVTAHDLEDALDLVAGWLIEADVLAARADLPPVELARAAIDVSTVISDRLGNPAWRGIWSPPDNLGGPTPLGSTRR